MLPTWQLYIIELKGTNDNLKLETIVQHLPFKRGIKRKELQLSIYLILEVRMELLLLLIIKGKKGGRGAFKILTQQVQNHWIKKDDG